MSETAYLASAVIGVLSASITGYVVTKIALKNVKNQVIDIAPEVFESVITELPSMLSNTEVQKGLYSVGLLIGNGAKQGLGFSPAGKSPKGLMGLITTFAPMFLGKKGEQVTQETGENPFNVG